MTKISSKTTATGSHRKFSEIFRYPRLSIYEKDIPNIANKIYPKALEILIIGHIINCLIFFRHLKK